MKLSILDQSMIKKGGTAVQALQETVSLAEMADELGYHRFWMSEHHAVSLGHSSPEIMIAHVANRTKRIRVGSGGVMLPHYSAYKVAETFRLLEALFPERIDLGIGRAPGGMPAAKRALQEHRTVPEEWYDQQVRDVLHYLGISKQEKHRFGDLQAMPNIKGYPSLWLLGSSGSSTGLASYHGLGFAFAQFIRGEKDPVLVESYRKAFQPSAAFENPNAIVALFMVCAETDEAAEKLALSHDIGQLLAEQGKPNQGLLPLEEAAAYKLSPYEKERLQENRNKMLVGSPETILKQLQALKKEYDTEEFLLASPVYDEAAKQTGYRLLMQKLEKVTD